MRTSVLWAFCLLALLAPACGGGSGTSAAALLSIEPPNDPDILAVAVHPDGTVEALRGLTEKDRAAGRRRPSRIRYPEKARQIRIVADGAQAWLPLKAELDRKVQTGEPTVDLTVLDGDWIIHRLVFRTGFARAPESIARQRVHLRLSRADGALRLEAGLPGGAWLRAHGCGESRSGLRTWIWEGGPPPSGFSAFLHEALGVVAYDPSSLDVWLAVEDSAEGDAPPRIADVAAVLDDLLRAGLTKVDLGLRGQRHGRRIRGMVEQGLHWLAAHQAADGSWDPDAWATWCHGAPIVAGVPGDGEAAFETGATGLALSAFLGAGYTCRGRHPFAKVVGKGLKHLKRRQAEDGTFDPPGTPYRARNHALAALALCRAYEMTESPLWTRCSSLAVAALPELWRDDAGDVAATGYACLAVHAVRHMSAYEESKGRPPTWSLDETFVGDLHRSCRALTRSRGGLELAVGIAGCLLLGDDPHNGEWADVVTRALEVGLARLDSRELMFLGIAAWRLRKPTYSEFVTAAKPGYAPSAREGHPCCLGGSWDPPTTHYPPGGRIQTTANLAMAMEIYYRYDKALR